MPFLYQGCKYRQEIIIYEIHSGVFEPQDQGFLSLHWLVFLLPDHSLQISWSVAPTTLDVFPSPNPAL